MTTAPSSPPRWSQRSGPERFEAMTRWSIYAVFAIEPFMALLMVAGRETFDGASPLAYLGLIVVHALVGGWVFGPAMRSSSGRGPVPWRGVALLLALTVLIWVVALLGFPGAGSGAGGLALLVPATGTLGALAPLPRSTWTLVAIVVGVVALATAVLALTGSGSAELIATAVGGTLALVGCSLSFRLSVWTMGVVWELDDARAVAGRLAVAEERLRFSRDLHDVFGRALSTVAVKSELAAALAERGDPRGAEQMLEVRRLAHDALREVRGVVQGYRAVDLPTEIAGARELLRSAGVDCRVAGESLELPEPVAEAAGWVVREGVTNVVRHANATRCEIEVREAPHGYLLRITNDGAAAGTDPGTGGSGLHGLRERLTARGGSLLAAAEGGTFVVEATIPAITQEEER